jgi:hypothetical protein
MLTFVKRCVLAVALLALAFPCLASQTPASGTARLVLDGNRIYAELAFVRPDGTLRKALAFVDLGSPAMIVSEALFKELQLSEKAKLTFQVGEKPVQVDSSTVTKDAWLPFPVGDGRNVEALLPAGVMQKFQVVIDYARSSLTLAQPGTLKPEGVPVAMRVNEKTGLIAVEVSVDGQTYPMTMDCGSAYTWLRKTTAQSWLSAHAEWERGIGAVGPSNMRMADDGIEATGTLLRIPEIQLGGLQVRQIGALAIGPSKTNWDFLDWYSEKNPERVIGWLGGNVLRAFRITIDYPDRKSYWLREAEVDSHDLEQIGLTLKSQQGGYFVTAIVRQRGRPTVEGVEVGDRLLQVDGLQTKTATWGAIFAAMHGKPGELRTLVLERDGRQFTVHTRVVAF